MSSAPEQAAPLDGLYLYGVVRARGRRVRRRADGDPVTRVRYREIEALVRPVEYVIPDLDDQGIQDHHHMLDAAMRRATVLPAPFGMVFHGRRAVLQFLEDQYIVLDEGLSFLDGHWEMRLHILGDDNMGQLNHVASELYSDLRRLARAAIPLPAMPGRILSAAFLVERRGWIRFVEETDDLNRAHPELVFDLTGPWPPYDFVDVQL